MVEEKKVVDKVENGIIVPTDPEVLAMAKVRPVETMVTQKEFKGFQDKVDSGFTALMEKLDELKTAVPPVAIPVVPDDAAPSSGDSVPVPPAWRTLVTQILGPDFEVRRKDMPSGEIKLHIIVPREKSNAGQEHWENFREDVRNRVILHGEVSVKEYCIKIRNNLLASGKSLVQYP